MSNETDYLTTRWRELQEGAALGAMLTHAARRGGMDDVAAAVHALDRKQLEAATFAMVLIHAGGAPLVDPPTDG